MERSFVTRGVTKVEEFAVGDVWYGRHDTIYRDVKATIDRIMEHQVRFDKVVTDRDGQGKVFSKTKFKRLFSKSEQLNLFKRNRW